MTVLLYQNFTPSDGARINKTAGGMVESGVRLHVLNQQNGLQENDLVIAVNQVKITFWLDNLWKENHQTVNWRDRESVIYQVIRNGDLVNVSVSLGNQPWGTLFIENWGVILFAIILQILGLAIILLRPEEPAARSLFIWAFTSSHFYVWSSYLQVFDIINLTGFVLYHFVTIILWVSSQVAMLNLALTFPKPVKVLQKQPQLIWVNYASGFLLYGLMMTIAYQFMPNRLAWVGISERVDALIAMIYFGLTVVVVFYQFRSFKTYADRQKMYWFIFSGLISCSIAMLFYLLPEALGLPRLGVNAVGMFLLPFLIGTTIAIWRYQLFDINLIINRTLVYGTLTFCLTLIYLGIVFFLQWVIQKLTGGANQSEIAIASSTLVVALLFNPLRIWIQNNIDRRFYRKKYDVEKTLEAFSKRIRQETDLDILSSDLLVLLNETMQPQSASIWFTTNKRKKMLNETKQFQQMTRK